MYSVCFHFLIRAPFAGLMASVQRGKDELKVSIILIKTYIILFFYMNLCILHLVKVRPISLRKMVTTYIQRWF